ncbi:MAG: hypothetical protein WB543_18590, partial [Candidatus Acidiferrum sp.]
DADRDRNLQNCMEALGECDHSQLSSDERLDVARATRDHNLSECLEGSDNCDLTRLDASQRREIADASAGRKLHN